MMIDVCRRINTAETKTKIKRLGGCDYDAAYGLQ